MSTRKVRIELITTLIKEGKVFSQEQLQLLLADHGVKVTQATLSRDLHEIGAVRQLDSNKKLHYTIPANNNDGVEISTFFRNLPSTVMGQRERFGQAVLSVAVSRNMVVIKTQPGYASGLAVEIDMIGSPYILGTVSGGDTVIMVIDEELNKEQINQLLTTFIPKNLIGANSKKND